MTFPPPLIGSMQAGTNPCKYQLSPMPMSEVISPYIELHYLSVISIILIHTKTTSAQIGSADLQH